MLRSTHTTRAARGARATRRGSLSAYLLKPNRGQVTLRLNSMMDILTILLLFLLKSFVAEGEAATPTPGVALPVSAGRESPNAAIVVAISRDAIVIGGETVSTLDDVRESDERVIAPLATRLERLRGQQEELARLRGEELALRPVSIQGDREMEFRVLERVMTTLAESGYESVSLAVVEGS